MKLKTFDHMNCSLAQTLNIIGERWSLLILRDAFFGTKRFDEFQANLGIARNMLATRLKQLTDEGVLEKVRADAGHFEYRLTPKGLDLQPVLVAMTHWGDKHKPNPKEATGRPVEVKKPTQRPSVEKKEPPKPAKPFGSKH